MPVYEIEIETCSHIWLCAVILEMGPGFPTKRLSIYYAIRLERKTLKKKTHIRFPCFGINYLYGFVNLCVRLRMSIVFIYILCFYFSLFRRKSSHPKSQEAQNLKITRHLMARLQNRNVTLMNWRPSHKKPLVNFLIESNIQPQKHREKHKKDSNKKLDNFNINFLSKKQMFTASFNPTIKLGLGNQLRG